MARVRDRHLEPPPVGSDIVDDFLFETRSGFCAHYAGAMTFVLRAAGIPARVVAGYQGGEVNPAGNYLSVRQFDAHAWVEYWQAGQGWTSVDPTFAVAPERIEQGLEQALSGEQSFLADSPLSPLRYRQVAWLNQLRLGWDDLNHGWQRWVLGYQGAQQLQLLQQALGELSDNSRQALLLNRLDGLGHAIHLQAAEHDDDGRGGGVMTHGGLPQFGCAGRHSARHWPWALAAGSALVGYPAVDHRCGSFARRTRPVRV